MVVAPKSIRAAAWLLVLAGAGILASACSSKREAGGKCTLTEEAQLVACDGTTAALVCHNLRLTAVPCRGEHGCAGATNPACDESVAQEGEPCTTPESIEAACSVDRKKTLACRGGQYVAVRDCRGPKGCMPGFEATCDQTIAQPGDLCLHTWESIACSVDRKQLLQCKDDPKAVPANLSGTWRGPRAKLVQQAECPTTKGCQIGPYNDLDVPHSFCDYVGLAEGDKCGQGAENLTICSPDATSILKCDADSHTFKADFKCPKGQACARYPGDNSKVNPVVGCELSAPAKGK